GGMRTAELTLPGFQHDICSAIHPLGVASPFFSTLPLAQWGLEWVQPELPLAHPFDDGTAAVLARSCTETAESLASDGKAWQRLMQPFVDKWEALAPDILGPLRFPRHPLLLAQFGLPAIQSACGLARRFAGSHAQGLFAGLAAHSMLPLSQSATAAFGLVLGILGHAVGWPLPRGGAQAIADALAGYFRHLGGRIILNHEVRNLDELPSAAAVLFDVTPQQIVRIAGHRLPDRYVRTLRNYRYGCGIFKIDWALSEPVPWKAAACRRAGTVHLGATLEEIADAEALVWQGRVSQRPYVLVAQQSLFDRTRAPNGQHTLWAYCHVPPYSETDMTDIIENQLERFAPGFRQVVLARHTMTARQVQEYNPNYIGGDINGGVADLRQLFMRPALSRDPYATPTKGLFICSSSTPPGGGVHGLCGYHAAQSVLRKHK
ncbi:MAG: phytoene desaturase family protein, partial [Burkholderiales bacterium]